MDLGWRMFLAGLVSLSLTVPALASSDDPTRPIDRRVDFGAPGALDMGAFYRSKPQARTPDAPHHRAWGLSMNSIVPIQGLESSVDYSLTAAAPRSADTSAEESFAAGSNHLLRLQLASKWQDVAYGVRYFSVGEAFAADPLGRDLMNQAGIAPDAGSNGAEVWAQMKFPIIELFPTAKRSFKDLGGTKKTRDEFGLIAERSLYRATRIVYQYRTLSSVSQHANDQPDNANSRQYSVALKNPRWNVRWTGRQADLAPSGFVPREENFQQVSGTFRLRDALTISPSVSRLEAQDGSDPTSLVEAPLPGPHERSFASINLGYASADNALPDMNFRVRYDSSEGSLVKTSGLQASFGVKKEFDLGGLHRARTSVAASLTYRKNRDDFAGVVDDSLGFQVTFEHKVNG